MEVMGLMLGEFIDDYTVRPFLLHAIQGNAKTYDRSRSLMSLQCLNPAQPSQSSRSTTFFRRKCSTCSNRPVGQKWSWGGTTRTPGSGVGCPASM